MKGSPKEVTLRVTDVERLIHKSRCHGLRGAGDAEGNRKASRRVGIALGDIKKCPECGQEWEYEKYCIHCRCELEEIK